MSARRGRRASRRAPVQQSQTTSDTAPTRLSRSRAAKVFLLLGAVLVGLFLGELIVRGSGIAPDVIPIGITSEDNVYRRSTNPILSYEFKPGFRTDDEGVPPYYRRINSHGLRDVERQYEKPPGTKRIILLGDSVVVGYGCPEIDQLMSRQLEKLYADEPVEVLNMGVTGYCTRAEVELLRTKGLQYEPDLVVLVFVENDFRNFNPESIGSDGIKSRPAVVNSLFRHSHVFRLLCLQFNWFDFGLEADPERWNQEAIGDNNVVEGFELLRDLAEEHAFVPLVAAWPSFTNDAIEYPEKMLLPDSDELIVAELAEAFGLRFLGLREAFQEHWQSQQPRTNPRLHYTIGDEMHPSAAGHRATAEILHRLVDEHDLLETSEAPVRAERNQESAAAAISLARSLGDQKPGYGLVLLNKAGELRAAGELDAAASELGKVIQKDSLYAKDARLLLASIRREQGRLEEAQSLLREVLESDPDQVQAHEEMAAIDLSQNRVDSAIEHLEEVVRLRPENAAAHYTLGITFGKQERWDVAREHLRRAADLDPSNVDASNAWGTALAQAGRLQEAAQQFRHTLSLDAGNPYARMSLEKIHAQLGYRR